jgi:hypothetical protein
LEANMDKYWLLRVLNLDTTPYPELSSPRHIQNHAGSGIRPSLSLLSLSFPSDHGCIHRVRSVSKTFRLHHHRLYRVSNFLALHDVLIPRLDHHTLCCLCRPKTRHRHHRPCCYQPWRPSRSNFPPDQYHHASSRSCRTQLQLHKYATSIS